MGRPFVVELDYFNTNKFYVCRVCGTPLARNSDIVRYKMTASNELEGEFIWLSCLKKLSNVDSSDIKQEIVSGNLHVIGRQICYYNQKICPKPCHKSAMLRRTPQLPSPPPIAHKLGSNLFISHIYPGSHNVDALISDRTLFHINSDNLDHRTVSPEEWFDLPQSCANEQ